MTDPTPNPEQPDPKLPFETGRTYIPDNHPHPLRAKDIQALIVKRVG